MSDESHSAVIGARNPYALAELAIGRAINWSRVGNTRQLLEAALGLPYEKLFDPKFGGPVFAGLALKEKHADRDEKNPILAAHTTEGHLQALRRVLPQQAKLPVPPEGLPLGSQLRAHRLRSANGVQWRDPGHFFTDATQPLDVIQGAAADCYFLAALASVAWSHPFAVAQRTRPAAADGTFSTGHAVDMMPYFTGGKWVQYQVTELLPLQAPPGGYIYARADDPGETWPCVYEKAYAQLRSGSTSDQPNMGSLDYGDCVLALNQLTSLAGNYNGTTGMTADAIWQAVRANSLSFKTFNPMVGWTYSSAAAAPTPIDYANAHIVANHCYSILGWSFANNQEYIVLRNPWGAYEATLNVEGGSWVAYNGSFWDSIALSNRGIFALRADTFKAYFAGFGLVQGAVAQPTV